ncbi:MAG: 2OG-Fe(II) oxygenase [Kofleriaceae bacterium]
MSAPLPPEAWVQHPAWGDLGALARRWRQATPFPHMVLDDLLGSDDLDALLAVVDDEAVERYQADLYEFEATTPEPATAALRALRDGFAAALVPRLARIADVAITRADLRAYAYRPGHYLLPHTDHQAALDRRLAYAYYLPSPDPPTGGELELFACRHADDALVDIVSARRIAPRANRLVVFAVSDASLHRVHEVTDGLRLSLAGWFYP